MINTYGIGTERAPKTIAMCARTGPRTRSREASWLKPGDTNIVARHFMTMSLILLERGPWSTNAPQSPRSDV